MCREATNLCSRETGLTWGRTKPLATTSRWGLPPLLKPLLLHAHACLGCSCVRTPGKPAAPTHARLFMLLPVHALTLLQTSCKVLYPCLDVCPALLTMHKSMVVATPSTNTSRRQLLRADLACSAAGDRHHQVSLQRDRPAVRNQQLQQHVGRGARSSLSRLPCLAHFRPRSKPLLCLYVFSMQRLSYICESCKPAALPSPYYTTPVLVIPIPALSFL